MTNSKSRNIYKIAIGVSFVAVVGFSLIWIMSSYQYHIIKYQEEIQLFRTDFVYWQNYMQIPGGVLAYVSSFLTQFYYYPFIGAFIFTSCIAIVFILFWLICNHYGDIYHFFVLPFLILLLSVFIYNDIHGVYFTLAHLLGLIIALFAFLIFLKIKYKCLAGILISILVYFIAGGNVFILISLIILNEIFNRDKSYLFLLLIVALSLCIPYIAFKYLYVITLEKAYFSLTPFELELPNKLYFILWFSIPLIYFVWLFLCKVPLSISRCRPIILIIFYVGVLIGISFWGIVNYNKQEAEQIAHIAHEVEQGDWDKVIQLTDEVQHETNALFSYFRNIALSEKGMLISDMFKYTQTGTYGLFNEWKLYYTNTLFVGELYYWLGLPPAAEQCAYEAMITSPYEYSSKALRRLIQTSILKKDTESFEKYIRLFEKSFIYNKWAKQQRALFESFLASEEHTIPGFPQLLNYEDFFFYTENQEQNLFELIKYNPNNKKVFEYITAFLLLRKNLFEFQDLLDNYYKNMNYTQLPDAFEDAIIILIYNKREELADKYDIPYEAMELFVQFNEDMSKLKNNSAIHIFKNKYKDSYWLYFKFWQPLILDKMTNSSVY